jgi:selenocysteine lyase/cysteine desulfurase
LIVELLKLEHESGEPLVRIYGPHGTDRRGGTITFNFYDASGRPIDHGLVERRASERRISLRTGCFCNPGAGEVAMGISRPELEACFRDGGSRMVYEDLRQCLDPKTAGAVRVSVGLASNFDDAFAFVDFARGFLEGRQARG